MVDDPMNPKERTQKPMTTDSGLYAVPTNRTSRLNGVTDKLNVSVKVIALPEVEANVEIPKLEKSGAGSDAYL